MISSTADISRMFIVRKATDGWGDFRISRQKDDPESPSLQKRLQMSEQMRTLAGHLQTVREEERMRIAREIHDELGQVLTALKMDLSWIKQQLPAERMDLIQKAQSDLDIIGTAVQSVKRICTDLRPGILDTLGLGAAIEWKADDFERRNGIQCSVLIEPEDLTTDKDRTTALFRIFQEALTNIAKHAHATEIHASLIKDDEHIILEVSDNGIGIQPEHLNKPNSFGLLGMRERVIPWNGTVTIGKAGSRGTVIQVIVPMSLPRQGSLRSRDAGTEKRWKQLEQLLCSLAL